MLLLQFHMIIPKHVMPKSCSVLHFSIFTMVETSFCVSQEGIYMSGLARRESDGDIRLRPAKNIILTAMVVSLLAIMFVFSRLWLA